MAALRLDSMSFPQVCQLEFGSVSYTQVEQSSTLIPPLYEAAGAIKRGLPDLGIPSPERKRQKNNENLSTYDDTRETSTTSTGRCLSSEYVHIMFFSLCFLVGVLDRKADSKQPQLRNETVWNGNSMHRT